MCRIIYVLLLSVILQSCAVRAVRDLEAQNQKLVDRIAELESMLRDSDKDGLPDYSDVEISSPPGTPVDGHGRAVDDEIKVGSANPNIEDLENHVDKSDGKPIEANQKPTLTFCCENHNPRHCGTSFTELSRYASNQKCIFR